MSSTFKDLHAERDYLVRSLIPSLNERLFQHQIQVTLVDLRSGVNNELEDESEREAYVLRVCFNEIHHSRPYFIGILGGRYGWVPSDRVVSHALEDLSPNERALITPLFPGRSVTELEMLVGMLMSKDLLSHSFVCIKSDSSLAAVPENKKNTYLEPEARERLVDLKKRIREEFKKDRQENNIIDYDDSWGANSLERFNHLDELANAIYEDIIAENELVSRPVDENEAFLEQMDAFCRHSNLSFCGRQDIVEQEVKILLRKDNLLSESTSQRGRCLTGFSGCGKTAIFCNIYEHLVSVAEDNNLIILANVTGLTASSRDFNWVLKVWETILQKHLNINRNQIPTYKSIDNINWLARTALIRGFRLVILLDSWDSFIEETLPPSFDFIPLGIPILITSLPNAVEKSFLNDLHFSIVSIDGFNEQDAQEFVKFSLGYKEIPQIWDILNKRLSDGSYAYTSPLWLNMALTRIIDMDESDFNALDENNRGIGISCIVKSLPCEVESMFSSLLEKSFSFFKKETVLPALILMAISVNGITETDLSEIFGQEWSLLDFAQARRYFRRFIRMSEIDRRMQFNHDVLSKCIIKQYPELSRTLKKEYIAFLFNGIKDKKWRAISPNYDLELTLQLYLSDNVQALRDLSRTVDIAPAMFLGLKKLPGKALPTLVKFFSVEKMAGLSVLSSFLETAYRDLWSNNDLQEALLQIGMISIDGAIGELEIEHNGQYPEPIGLDGYFFDLWLPFRVLVEIYSSRDNLAKERVLLDKMQHLMHLMRQRWGDLCCYQNGYLLYYFQEWIEGFSRAYIISPLKSYYRTPNYSDYKNRLRLFFKDVESVAEGCFAIGGNYPPEVYVSTPHQFQAVWEDMPNKERDIFMKQMRVYFRQKVAKKKKEKKHVQVEYYEKIAEIFNYSNNESD